MSTSQKGEQGPQLPVAAQEKVRLGAESAGKGQEHPVTVQVPQEGRL